VADDPDVKDVWWPDLKDWLEKGLHWNRLKEGYAHVDERWLAGFRHTVGDFQRRQTGKGRAVSIKVA